MSVTEKTLGKLIHIAKYHPFHKGSRYLFLRQDTPHHFVWYEEVDGSEIETEVFAPTIEEALRLAHHTWKNQSFRTIICGFRYTLPERDEHGVNALFYQMVESYTTPNGTYFDQELGHTCFVQSASQEALDLWKKLESLGRLSG